MLWAFDLQEFVVFGTILSWIMNNENNLINVFDISDKGNNKFHAGPHSKISKQNIIETVYQNTEIATQGFNDVSLVKKTS